MEARTVVGKKEYFIFCLRCRGFLERRTLPVCVGTGSGRRLASCNPRRLPFVRSCSKMRMRPREGITSAQSDSRAEYRKSVCRRRTQDSLFFANLNGIFSSVNTERLFTLLRPGSVWGFVVPDLSKYSSKSTTR